MRHRSTLFAILLAVCSLGGVSCLPIQGARSGVIVHARFESPEPGTILYQQVGTNLLERRHRHSAEVVIAPTYTPVCEAPCEVDLDVGPPLYVAGQNIYPSKLFKIEDAPGLVSIKAQPGSFPQSMLGMAFIIAGVPSVVGGGMFSLVSEAFDPPRSREVTVGLSAIGIGVVAITLGAVLISTNETTVKLWSAPTLAPPLRLSSPPTNTFVAPR